MTAWTAAYQAPPSMVFSRQEYWSGVPSPSPRRILEGSKGGRRHQPITCPANLSETLMLETILIERWHTSRTGIESNHIRA